MAFQVSIEFEWEPKPQQKQPSNLLNRCCSKRERQPAIDNYSKGIPSNGGITQVCRQCVVHHNAYNNNGYYPLSKT